ncbi:hypothetical protein FOA43_000666 [Brettanomyces nanus]|uniref:Mediator of RNA polymerase II transcription subunit 17 n=1 Tax=Eeniella nana TaxID=13502 RepID=A0A875RWQ6_EENNA|nr:uncharacterized protein FOA43_000666 [Brettanomyces nanus]QPG73356.1 hypothetical protein FOA43_000666 [Brettanomyces nanus]
MTYLNINPVLTDITESIEGQESANISSLPLDRLLVKIVAQNGPFVNFTEDQLQKQIAQDSEKAIETDEAKDTDMDVDMPEYEESDAHEEVNNDGHLNHDEKLQEGISLNAESEHPYLSLESFMKQKEKAIGYVDSALNESSLSLDFVSLLISCVRPAAGSSSMSPHLKQNVKVGVLSGSSIDTEQHQQQQKEEDIELDKKNQSAGRGWKLQSLERVSSDLKSAAERLRIEIGKEKRYWDGMMDIVRSDEVVIPVKSRNSKSVKEIGVKFGFGDAGSNYFDKGIGLLRKNKNNGELYFEKKDVIQQMQNVQKAGKEETDKVVTVKLYKRCNDDNRTEDEHGSKLFMVGRSTNLVQRLDNLILDKSKSKVINDIRRARFFLFEEELFYQLMREASTLTSLQVKVKSDKIMVELHHLVLEIAFESMEEVKSWDNATELITEYNSDADEIGSFLRLMLCSQHRHNLQRRRLPPVSLDQSPLRSQTNEHSTVMLIRPLITYKKHERTIRRLKRILRSILIDLEGKDSEAEVDEMLKTNSRLKRFCNDPNQMRSVRKKRKLLKDNPFIRCLLSPLSVMELRYKEKLEVRIELTSSSSASYSSISVNVRLKSSVQPEKPNKKSSSPSEDAYDLSVLDVQFYDVREVEDCLNWVIRNYTK